MRADAEARIGNALADNRAHLFVGREKEHRLLERLLSREDPLRVLFFHGIGGIGKSTLLGALERWADEAGWAVERLDARPIAPEPQAARGALEAARSRIPADAAGLLLIDGFECWAALEAWLREEWIPELSDRFRIAIAGRRPPALGWRADPGWQGLLLHAPLAPLDDAEASEYLVRRGLAAEAHSRAVEVARGLPLTLALIADAAAASGAALSPEQIHGVLLDLLSHLVPDDPASPERRALYLSALARHVSAPLLAHGLEVDARWAADLCVWLDGLSFMERAPGGWFPHDVVRDELRRDLLRHPELRLRLLDRAVDHVLGAAGREIQSGRESMLADHFFLYRNFMPVLAEEEQEPAYPDAPRPDDLPRLCDAIERHEGREQRELFDLWWERQPEALTVVRGAQRELLGFYLLLELRDPPAECLARDPHTECFWAQRHRLARPLEPGEGAILVRMWMHLEEHMVSGTIGRIWALAITRRLIADARLVLGGVFQPDDATWGANNRLYGHREVEESRGRFGDLPVAVAVHDFTQESAVEWLRQTYRRFRERARPPAGAIAAGPLTAREVRSALRDLHRPHRLAEHALVGRIEGGGDPVALLQSWIEAECAALTENPKTAELHLVLDRAYLRPVGDQRAAAEACRLSWDQYRRRLTEAIKILTARLERGR